MLQITAVVIATAVKFCHLWPVKLFSLFLSLLDMTLLESLIASLFHRISSITKQYNNITMSIQLLPQTLNQPRNPGIFQLEAAFRHNLGSRSAHFF